MFSLLFFSLALSAVYAAVAVPSSPASSDYSTLDWTSVKDKNVGTANDFFTYGKNANDPIRGVNLGGWLVLEPWINTQLFSKDYFSNGNIPDDEFNFVGDLGYAKAGALLEAHYTSWINETDFKEIEASGLNAVRIPIGYWAYKLMSTDKYYKGSQDSQLQSALTWARKYNLKVWIDLHGAPGSQNGYDSSGHKNTNDWNAYDNMNQTKEVLNYMFAKYGGETWKDVVIGIELVNEPLVGNSPGIAFEWLANFYDQAISDVRNTVGMQQNVVVHDGYQNQGAWQWAGWNSDPNIVYDTHLYILYNSYYQGLNYEAKINQVCQWGDQLAGLTYKEVVGEFTAAWDSNSSSIYSQSISKWSDNDKAQISRFVQAQFNAFEKNYGWFFWNWKMGNSDQWDFQVLLKNKIIPSPITSRTYNDCK